jgi:uncharacterized protein
MDPSEPRRMPQRNVLGGLLEACCTSPMTGFHRNGSCQTGPDDHGAHVVCAKMTREFLAFSLARGNDLITPHPEWGFPGLKPGDRWCLCAARWKEALKASAAPSIVLASTHERALEFVPLQELKQYALDLN